MPLTREQVILATDVGSTTTKARFFGKVIEEWKFLARESIRMAFNYHKYLARELKGVKRERTISDIFEEVKAEETYIDMRRVDYIIGTGGLLSREPRRAQSMMILID